MLPRITTRTSGCIAASVAGVLSPRLKSGCGALNSRASKRLDYSIDRYNIDVEPSVKSFLAITIKMPRGRPREFDKEQALDTALRMFWQYGYEGTSISALAEAIGVTVPSLYLAFGNKNNLFMQAVEHYSHYSAKLYDDAFRQKSARDVALGILHGEVELVAGGDTPDGCLMVQSALATSPGSEAVQQAMAGLRRQAEAEVADRFERAGREGDLPSGWDPRALASYIMTVASGMAVQAKSGVSREDLLRVADMAMLIWPKN